MKSFLELIKNKFLKKEIVLKDPQEIVVIDLVQELNEFNKNKQKLNNAEKIIDYKPRYDDSQRQLKNCKEKCETYLVEIRQLHKSANEKNIKIKQLEEENKQLRSDCKEAADLLSLTEKGELINFKKTYKIDHFPKDVQDFIYDLIKEYYNAN